MHPNGAPRNNKKSGLGGELHVMEQITRHDNELHVMIIIYTSSCRFPHIRHIPPPSIRTGWVGMSQLHLRYATIPQGLVIQLVHQPIGAILQADETSSSSARGAAGRRDIVRSRQSVLGTRTRGYHQDIRLRLSGPRAVRDTRPVPSGIG
jgi:hypothetical protein